MTRTLLLVEDDRALREMLIEAFRQDSFSVAAFDNAEDALKFINKNETVDIVFLDIHLPDMSGFSFLENLTSTPKVVLVTSDKNLALTAYNFDLVVDYLVKPLQKDRFIEAINQC